MSGERVTVTVELPAGWTPAQLRAAIAGALPAGAGVAVRRRRVKPRREPIEQGAVIGRLVHSLAGRTTDGDLDPLVALYALDRQLDAAMADAAVAARLAGHSWTTIAGELGVSRQAARQRWGRLAELAGAEPDAAAAS